MFLACAEQSSFRKAAQKLKLNPSTVVRRIDRLEGALGTRLFQRVQDGVMLTADGKAIVESACQMEAAVFNVIRDRTEAQETEREQVTISITEGLGSYWVMPHLVERQRQFPQTIVNLRCAMESADVLRLEADMAVQFIRPTSPDLVVVKLGRLHIYPYAAQSYLDMYGTPASPQDMTKHRLVQQVAPQIDDSVWGKLLGLESVEEILGICTNASTAHFYAIEKGAGIGALPTYASPIGAPVVPVDIGVRHQLDIWLTYHPDMRNLPRKALVIDWLRSIFDPAKYPWFRDEFIHPLQLAGMVDPNSSWRMDGCFSATLLRSEPVL